MMRSFIKNLTGLFFILLFSSQAFAAGVGAGNRLESTPNDYTPYPKGDHNPLLPILKNVQGERSQRAYSNVIIKDPRGHSDCMPFCPKINVWKYQLKDKNGKLHESSTPISTRREFWKHRDEARIIATTLFGNNRLYLDGLLGYMKSFKTVETLNRSSLRGVPLGMNTFTFRVYVAKRHPSKFEKLGEIGNATDENFIKELLNQGAEIAYVDNDRPSVGKDATFWRFMIMGEPMEPGQKIRYLVRDADWMLTAAEVFSVGEWIASGLEFHRMNLFPACISPVTASIFAGTHTGKGPFADIQNQMEQYPYRLTYGDDEVFLRDRVWPMMKYRGSVLTHQGKRGPYNKVSIPYKGSCEEPTQKYCEMMTKKDRKIQCPDKELPESIYFPFLKISKNTDSAHYLKSKKLRKVFYLPNSGEELSRIQKAITSY